MTLSEQWNTIVQSEPTPDTRLAALVAAIEARLAALEDVAKASAEILRELATTPKGEHRV